MIASNATLTTTNKVKPTHKNAAVWIDISDLALGILANGAAITNKGNNGATFAMVGGTAEVVLGANGNKRINWNGSFMRCTSSSAAFTKYHNGLNQYVVQFIGQLGSTASPDAFLSICGNNGSGSANIGFACYADNRVATAAGNRGFIYQMTRGQVSVPVFQSLYNNGSYNTDVSLHFVMESFKIIDESYLVKNGEQVAIADVRRSGANTTSGLGTAIAPVGTAPTFAFEIGAVGNGALPMAAGSSMEQFVIYDALLNSFEINGVNAYFGYYFTRGNSTIRTGRTRFMIVDNYILGGTYAKNASRTKTVFTSTRGPNHFTPGSNRDLIKLISTKDGFAWPTAYTEISPGGINAYHVPCGGYSPAGTLVTLCAKYNATTGVYAELVAIRSTDDGTTWGAEIPITLPVTSPALTGWIPHDVLVTCNNGDIAVMLYAWSTTALYKIYVVRSTDDGLTWSFTQVYTSGSVYINESSAAWLGGNDWIIWSRVEVAVGGVFVYKQFRSTDDLVTFSDQGNTTFGGGLYAHPPMLRSFLIDGTRVIEASWVNRDTRRMHAKYATAAGIIANGLSEWTNKTTYQIGQRLQGTTTGWITGYPVYIHSRNDLNMQGVWFEENSSSETRVAMMFYNDQHKTKIKTELGI